MKTEETIKERKNKRSGVVVTTLVHAVVLLLFFILGLSSKYPPETKGILVNFGTMKTGFGDQPSEVKEQTEELTSTESAEVTPVQEPTESQSEVVTQEVEEAPAVVATDVKEEPKKEPEKKKEEKPVIKEDPKKPVKEEEKQPEKEEPKVDTKSLYTGQVSDENNPSNEGNTYGPGDQGDPEGDAASDNYEGIGKGNEGIDVSLGNRKLEYLPPIKATSNEFVKIVVEIKVDLNGNVISARQLLKGSTSTDQNLVAIAIDAAKKTKFNSADYDKPLEIGTMTFTFKPR